jgi:dephospho-CoA kinase
MSNNIVIGLTGTKASGKGVVADYLKNMGFGYYSLSDRVREEAVRRGIHNYTIRQLQDIGNELREKHGLGVLAEMTMKEMEEGNCIIDGIRNPGEIKILRWQENFYLIGVDAPQEQRRERLIKRARSSDPKTEAEFLEMDKRDLGIGGKNVGQQVYACIKMADHFIRNDSTIGYLHKTVQEILGEIMAN